MRVRIMSSSGDYTFGNGQMDFYRDVPEGVGQIIKTGLLLWLGEWYLNTAVGMPWLEGVLGKHGQTTADTTIQDQILNTQGVVNIQSFSSEIDPDTRQYSAQAKVNTLYGVTQVQLDNYVNF